MEKIIEEKRKIAFFPAHPSQVWILKEVAEEVSKFADTIWFLRDKEISTELADFLGIEYHVISKAGRGIWGNAKELFTNILKSLKYTRKHKIDIWVTKYSSGNIASWLLRKKSISFIDDDIDVIPFVAWTSFPFANVIFAPNVTRMGRFDKKTIRFPGNFELCYLHPNRFSPDPTIFNELGLNEGEKYAIIRLSALQAHHDTGIRGINEELLRKVIKLTDGDIRLFITSEKPISAEFEQYRLPIKPERIHHALYYAEFLLSDSQTMTQESAVLGTPAFRINDFVGRVSIMNKLEELGLSYGFKPGEERQLLDELKKYLALDNRKDIFQVRREEMLKNWIDPVPLFVNVIKMLLDGASFNEIRKLSET